MLELHRISKSYDGKAVLRDISFTVEAGETICLLGASGSGKSTLLQIIAGLEQADSGFVSFAGQDLTPVPAHRRDFGLVFQDYALFPHLDVSENVAFGLRMRRLSGAEILERVATALERVNLEGFDHRRVTDLSGGEQQRVALARALAIRPQLLMFDEPLGALDRTLRQDLLSELRSILDRTPVPAIYVTHDQEEAFAIADRLLILHEGEIVRQGRPQDIWARPGSVFVAEFLGLGTIFEGELTRQSSGSWQVESRLGTLHVRCGHDHHPGEKVSLLARPFTARDEGDRNVVGGVVSDVVFQQDGFRVTLENGLYGHLPEAPGKGDRVEVSVKVECLA